VAVETIGIVVDIFSLVETVLAYFGAIIIAYGGFVALFYALKLELKRPEGLSYKTIRGGFASRVILGLDFLIASDILATIGHPDINEVIILGGIVLIRTVLTVILSQETKEMEGKKSIVAPKA
jgi:uncharacterized membrane protein